MDTKTFINKAITIIDFVLAPNQMIKIGPRATFGREFKIVKNGSLTSANVLNKYINKAIWR